MRLKVTYSSAFKKDFKKLRHKKNFLSEFQRVIEFLIEQQDLPPKYRDHKLTGRYAGYRDCHIFPDIVLIYKISGEKLLLSLIRLGSHSKLF